MDSDLQMTSPRRTTNDSVVSQQLSFANLQHYQLISKKSHIEGPYTIEQIAYKYLRREISGIIWIKECEPDTKWYQLDLDELKKQNCVLCEDKTFKIRNSDLESSLHKVKRVGIWITNKYPNENEHVSYCWSIFNMLLVIIMALHGNIGLIFVFTSINCCFKHKCYFIFARFVWSIICIFTSLSVCYLVLLYGDKYDEIQSWMIGYISWISITQIQWISDSIMQLYKYEKGKKKLSNFRMKILGIKLRVKTDLFKDWKRDFWIVPVSSLVPAMVIGFFANYFLEEKFLLKCKHKYKTGAICYEDGGGCCRVINSFDVLNLYAFVGGLASNILAMYGLIRFIAWFVVKKHKKLKNITQKIR